LLSVFWFGRAGFQQSWTCLSACFVSLSALISRNCLIKTDQYLCPFKKYRVFYKTLDTLAQSLDEEK
jgi:hypothetical protein